MFNILKLIIFFVIIFKSNCFIVSDNKALQSSVVSNIVTLITSHNIIFHYDNCTQQIVGSIIYKAGIEGSVLLGNYDLPIVNQNTVLNRPTGYKFLHVVLLTNYSRFIEYTNSSRFSFHYLDIILMVANLEVENDSNNSDIMTPKYNIWLKHVQRAGAFFILEMLNFTVYNVCFYCGSKYEVWQKVADLSEITNDYYGDLRTLLHNIYKEQFTDFNEHLFDLGYTIYRPFFWCELVGEDNESFWYDLYGSEGKFLELIHDKLNMRFHLVEFVETENNWMALIESIRNGSLDWAIGGITSTIKRMQIVEFTNYIHTEPFVVLYSVYVDPWMSWQSVIIPFEMTVWIVLVISIVVIASLFLVILRKTKFGNKITFYYLVQGCLRFLVEQPLPRIREAMKSRLATLWLMVLWLLIAFIMTNAYKTKLTSSLINSRTEEYDGVDDLVELDFNFFVTKDDSSVLQENLQTSGDKHFLEILKRATNNSELCDAILQTSGQKHAVIDEGTNIQYSIQNYCSEMFTMEQQEDLRLLKNDLFLSQHAWAMPMNTPYRHAINTLISRLHAAGLFFKWNRDYASTAQMVPKSYEKRSTNFQSTRNRFRLQNMIGPAIIWFLGIIAAALAFICELVHGRKNIGTRKKK